MNVPVSKNGPGEATDDELCARMGRGDSSALAALFQRHGSRLLFMGKVILGDASEAEDVVQEVFFEAWRKARTFDAERGSVRTWLAVRMRSRCLDRKRSSGATRTVLSSSMDDGIAPPESRSSPERHADHATLVRSLAALPEEQRDVLLLGYFEDLSSQEIATALAIPVGTVKSRVRRALSELRQFFGAREEG
jgi:RNA polymerase sigma-70 factor (ECF subfamily)